MESSVVLKPGFWGWNQSNLHHFQTYNLMTAPTVFTNKACVYLFNEAIMANKYRKYCFRCDIYIQPPPPPPFFFFFFFLKKKKKRDILLCTCLSVIYNLVLINNYIFGQPSLFKLHTVDSTYLQVLFVRENIAIKQSATLPENSIQTRSLTELQMQRNSNLIQSGFVVFAFYWRFLTGSLRMSEKLAH